MPISEAVTVGFARLPEIAILKALAEWLERIALREGAARGDRSCMTERSDGMAAFPVMLPNRKYAMRRARGNAFREAIERFAWSTWWDDPSVSHSRLSLDAIGHQSKPLRGLIAACREIVDILDIEAIVPALLGAQQARLVILIAHLKRGGVITGGAAGSLEASVVWERAASELFRHCLAMMRVDKFGVSLSSFYQQRLAFFGSGEGNALVQERLNRSGISAIRLPKLEIDHEIDYSASHLAYAHRCLFRGQPIFMGGTLERLCI